MRNFIVDEPGYQSPGSIIALREVGVLRVVTFSPHSCIDEDMPEGSADEIVNKCHLAAWKIKELLRLDSDDYSFWHN